MRNSYSLYALNFSGHKRLLVGESMDDLILKDYKIAYCENKDDCINKHDCRPIVTPCRHHSCLPRVIKDLASWIQLNYKLSKMAYDNQTLYVCCDDYTQLQTVFEKAKKSVSVLTKLSNKDYDALLSSSVVFLDLFDSAAVNTVIECIVRNTPVIINKTAGVVEMLGHDYPAYYDNTLPQYMIDERVNYLLTDRMINETSRYLRKISSKKYDIQYFINDFKNVLTTTIL
jgi:hypothetical protein